MTSPTAIILAAGRGSRLGRRHRLRPKCLIRLGGKTLLDWQLAALRTAGIHDIVLVSGYRDDLLSDRAVTKIVQNLDWNHSGPLHSLLCADPSQFIGDFLVVYGDCVFDSSIFSRLLNCRADIAVATDESWKELWSARFADIHSDAERFRHDDGRLIEIAGRATSDDDIQGQFMGLLKFSRDGWRRVCDVIRTFDENELRMMDMTTLLANLLRRGIYIATVSMQGRWCEVDSDADLAVYRRLLRRRSWTHDWRPRWVSS